MKIITSKLCSELSIIATIALGAVCQVAQAHEHYRSEASKVLADYKANVEDRSVQAQVTAANEFITTLDEGQKKKFLFPIDSKERGLWTNLPTPKDEKGLRFSDLKPKQVEACLKMLATLLGESGYETAIEVSLADDELIPVGEKATREQGYGVENFVIMLFGEPSVDQVWGLQYDGHHLVYNLTIKDKSMTMSPSFIGTRPSKFTLKGKEVQPIKKLYDKAIDVIELLDDEQQKQVVISKKHFDLRSGPGKDGKVQEPRGIKVSALNEDQKKALLGLIAEYTSTLPTDVAKQRNAELEKELDEMYFAWGGSTEEGNPISYAIQSPSLIIEYACRGGGKQALDHIHAIYRNPKNEYGAEYVK